MELSPGVRQQVSDLVSLYCLLWDDRRYEEWIRLFDDAATFDWRGRIARGPGAIQAMIGAGNAARPDGPGVHIMANTVVGSDDDGVFAVSDFAYLGVAGGRYECLFAGRTYDRFVERQSGWLIARRAVRFLGDEPPPGEGLNRDLRSR